MFIRYEIDKTQTSSTTHVSNMMSDLRNIIFGNITSPSSITSSICNTALTEISGSVNTDLYSLDYSSTYEWRIKKFHYNKDTGNSYTPASMIHWSQATSNIGWARILNYNNTNPWPRSASNTYWAISNINSTLSKSYQPHQWDRVLIFISDYWFICQIWAGTFMKQFACFDYEDSVSDQYAYSVNPLISPQIGWVSQITDMTSGVAQTTSTLDYSMGRYTYMSRSGNVFSSTSENTDDYWYGALPSSMSHYNHSLSPSPRLSQTSVKISGGAGHMLAPTFIIPSTGTHANGAVNYGKIPYFYRTTDDIAQAGDEITFGGVDYSVIPLHKTGGYNINDADSVNQACYLVPKLIGGA